MGLPLLVAGKTALDVCLFRLDHDILQLHKSKENLMLHTGGLKSNCRKQEKVPLTRLNDMTELLKHKLFSNLVCPLSLFD